MQEFKKGDKLVYGRGEDAREVTVIKTGHNKVVGKWYDVEADAEAHYLAPFRISERNTPGWFNSLRNR